MGFVQISMDFGFSSVATETTAPQNGHGANGHGKPASQAGTNAAETRLLRRLAPPPPDRILAIEEDIKQSTPEMPVVNTEMVPPVSKEDSVVPEENFPEEQEMPEKSTEESSITEEETKTETPVPEEEKTDVPLEEEMPAEPVMQEEVPQEEVELSPVQETDASVDITISFEEEEMPEPQQVIVSEETDDDGPVEFDLEPDGSEEDLSIEKQVAIAYFQKADTSDEEGEVFEIPLFSRSSTLQEPRPVVIARVKEKKETAAVENKSKRGRKSIREMMAEAEMVEIPEDDILFQKQYYGISEVAKMFGVNNSLIRFWETEFDIVKPRKNRKGDRLFRPVDVKNLHLIHNLLRLKKFTIEGAKDFLKNNKKKAETNFEMEQSLKRIRNFLLQMKADIAG